MSNEARIARLEDAVKHLILSKQDEEKLANYFDEKMSLEEHHKRDQAHKTVFQKFLHWVAG
jgi:hypothetical protein